jgi:protein-S-isoprenylcysteine O-methyltransferase Ste14
MNLTASRLLSAIARKRVPLGTVCAVGALWLAQPTWHSLALAALPAVAGEALRFWAAGHLLKGREVTRSGPYRFTRHPLYLGSFLLGIGFCVAAANIFAAMLVLSYLALTLLAAMQTEEAALDARFGTDYARYRAGELVDTTRRFSLRQAIVNHEHVTVFGLFGVAALLVAKILFSS